MLFSMVEGRSVYGTITNAVAQREIGMVESLKKPLFGLKQSLVLVLDDFLSD